MTRVSSAGRCRRRWWGGARLALVTIAANAGGWSGLAVAEESCAADGGGSPECVGDPDEFTSSSPTLGISSSSVVVPTAKAGLIEQEVEELKGFVHLCKERIELLKELRDLTATGHNLSLPAPHVQFLKDKVPVLAEMEVDREKMPAASSDDFFISKAIIHQEVEVNFVRFLPLRSARTSSSPTSTAQTAMPSALLVAMQPDGVARIFTPQGDLVLSFHTGHETTVEHLAVSPSHDEYLIVTGDTTGVIRVHKITVRQRRPAKQKRSAGARPAADEEKSSQYLGLQVNVTSQFNKQMELPRDSGVDEQPRITALAMASQQGSKYFVAGDSLGKVSVFTKNGTLRSVVDTTIGSSEPGAGVTHLFAHLSSLLFRNGQDWGFVDLERMEARRVHCPRFEGNVSSIIIDSQQVARLLVADQAGTIWVFNVKDKRDCKVEHRFAKGATHAPISLGSVRGFLIGLEQPAGSATVLALNMSHVGKRKNELAQAPSPVVWRRERAPVRSWAVHKRYQQGDLLAFLSEDGHEIEIAELLMQVYQAPAGDSFSNFKLPVIAVAVVLVLGYQFMKQKGGMGGSGGGVDFTGLKGRRGGLGKLGGLHGRGGLGGGLAGLGGGLGARGGLGKRF